MHQSRTYPSNSSYSGGQDPEHQVQTQFPPYHRDFNQQQGPGNFYVQGDTDGGTACRLVYTCPGVLMWSLVAHPNQYYRSMSPIIPHPHRYTSSGGDPRYYESPGGGGSPSSHISQSGYHSQSSYYSPQYPLTTEHQRSKHSHPVEAQFIPTPSEIAHAYPSYPSRQIPMSPRSPTTPPDNPFAGSQYPPPHSLIPSPRISSQRPTRISTSRPRTASMSTSPTTVASPPAERFPCEKCGKTFSRSHDRKRHHETQHMVSPVIHRCRYCEKEFSRYVPRPPCFSNCQTPLRADSLKRHLDNGCEEMP